jgi:hypothetical protein
MAFSSRGHHLRREVCKVHGKTHYYNAGAGQRIELMADDCIEVINYSKCECGEKGHISVAEYCNKDSTWYRIYLEELNGQTEVTNEWGND